MATKKITQYQMEAMTCLCGHVGFIHDGEGCHGAFPLKPEYNKGSFTLGCTCKLFEEDKNGD
jgi:hypothetical protein